VTFGAALTEQTIEVGTPIAARYRLHNDGWPVTYRVGIEFAPGAFDSAEAPERIVRVGGGKTRSGEFSLAPRTTGDLFVTLKGESGGDVRSQKLILHVVGAGEPSGSKTSAQRRTVIATTSGILALAAAIGLAHLIRARRARREGSS
jgi:hypothetical protein